MRKTSFLKPQGKETILDLYQVWTNYAAVAKNGPVARGHIDLYKIIVFRNGNVAIKLKGMKHTITCLANILTLYTPLTPGLRSKGHFIRF